jgi:hypothetical protein
MKLNYTETRPDGTTISQLRGYILVQNETIAITKDNLRQAHLLRNEYIARLSQDERLQLVLDNQDLFPNGLPTIHEVPYVHDPDFKPTNSATHAATEEMIGDYVRKNLDDVLAAVAPEARDEERPIIRQALLNEANRMDPEGRE